MKIEQVINNPSPQKIPDVATAIEMMTIRPAELLKHESKTGSLEVGKFADLIILSQDILTTPTQRIPETRVLLTLLGGEAVYRDEDF